MTNKCLYTKSQIISKVNRSIEFTYIRSPQQNTFSVTYHFTLRQKIRNSEML